MALGRALMETVCATGRGGGFVSRVRLIITLVALVALVVVASAQSKTPNYPTVLGSVGPGATISLELSTGQKVSSLKPGHYSLVVQDRSTKDAFHIRGHGFDLMTSVTGTGKKTWKLTLLKGTYLYWRDPGGTKAKLSFSVS
jgi:hypothetical protein